MKQRGLAPILIILLLAAAIGGYFIYQKQTKPASVQQITQPSPNPKDASPAPTGAEETANWKTYYSDKYGYSFKYPANLTIQTGSSVTSYAYDVQLDNANYNINFCKPNYCTLPDLSESPLSFQKGTLKKTSNLVVSGKDAYRIEGQMNVSNRNSIYSIWEIISLGDNKKMEIDTNILNDTNPETVKNILDKILTTFKFIK